MCILIEKLISSRKSVRVFDKDYKITDKEIIEMIDIAQKAPSSNNLQPWKFVVVSTDAAKSKVDSLFINNRAQFETSSHLIFVFGNDNKFEDGINISKNALKAEVISQAVSSDQIKKFEELSKLDKDLNFYKTIYFDLGLVVMNLMLVVKNRGYDSCAIGGFNKNKVNEVLNLPDNYLPAMVLAVGKSQNTENNNSYATYRSDAVDNITIIK